MVDHMTSRNHRTDADLFKALSDGDDAKLLNLIPENQPEKLMLKNEAGKTLLHATATSNRTVEAAAEMLRRAPLLLSMTDRLGETALFRSARYGKTQTFKFLEAEVRRKYSAEPDFRKFLFRDNKATILHAAIHSENFIIDPSTKERTSRVPILREVQKQKHKSESAKKLATLLIEKDTSWEATEPRSDQNRIKPHKYGGGDTTAQQIKMQSETHHADIIITSDTPDSPLLLATKSGCTEIVKKILEVYPQAIEHIDEDGRHILHVAIKYRRMDIYKAVIDMKNPLTRLRAKIDKRGNSILHMVGLKVTDQNAEEDIRSPALVLRDDLILFESVKKICTTLATLQVNNDGVTAEQLFIKNNVQLRIDAKEWMKSTVENCSIVAVLISTVAFAAAYTVPGGPNQQTGYPLLKNKPFFIVFALADALSLTFSLTSVIIFLSILTSSFRLTDFRDTLHNKLLLGLTVLILSVSMMMIAFAATLVLTISSRQDWTNVILYTISFFPVSVFVCSHVNLYKLLIKAFEERVRRIMASILPNRAVESPQAIQQPTPASQNPTTSFTESTTCPFV
ncbi:ankyrin repeat-containing protein ITN1-like [Cynara cardunculus var. scolymus]|uniref:ankyrin repeat-containing protein ITN1-like n=1 Tax=Cynara cardunculus var. scolymus TaxID=59895 RepID=UPI000D628EA7|nr:ankyrin repeat-containing protein ITN1-like [Cynara cardunculus var. scolymus]